jgi:cAMP-specific phosphodiesterase 4/calcium/calmodulin-dependent 3',5'-cyclic nucleotide phosphodiesterase
MLCDRNTTNVAKSQPGFIGFVPMPMFISLQHIMPELSENIEALKTNLKKWKVYEETEEDKKVYKKKEE